MDIDTPLKSLGEVNVEPLRQAILDLDEAAWIANQQRQIDYDVHRQTQSIVLVFCDGPARQLVVSKQEGWDLLAEADYIVELGPEGGPGGGQIVYQGRVAGILKSKRSPTAPYLRELLAR